MAVRPFVPAPGVIQVKYSGLYQTRPWNNIVHVHFTPETTAITDLSGFCTAMENAWTSAIAPQVSNAAQLKLIQAVDLTSQTGVSFNLVPATPPSGSENTLAPLPPSCAAVLSFAVSLRFRGGHCRMYLPGQDNSKTTNGFQFTTSKVSLLSTAATNFVTAVNAITISGASCKLCMLSAVHSVNGVPGQIRNPRVPFDITGATAHSRLDTQRRRLGKELP